MSRPAGRADINAWNIDMVLDGAGLSLGRGTVQQVATVYADKCAVCHGATGTEGLQNRLVGGQGAIATDKPVKTICS